MATVRTVAHVGVTTDDRGVATVVIDHPPINLMTIGVFLELAEVTERLAGDDDVRVVVLRSAHPEWFVAHFDVAAILSFPTDPAPPNRDDETASAPDRSEHDGLGRPGPTQAPKAPDRQLNTFHLMCERLRTMPKATIAVIEGRVGGGGSELALSCDLRFAAPAAVFSQPEVALGIIPGGSGTVRLPRLIGRSRALEAILGCDDVDAATAERWGWVNRVLAAGELWPFVDRLCRRIASFPPHAVAAAKASVLRAEAGVTEQLLAEGDSFAATLGHPETRAAMQGFLDAGGQTPDVERRLGELFTS